MSDRTGIVRQRAGGGFISRAASRRSSHDRAAGLSSNPPLADRGLARAYGSGRRDQQLQVNVAVRQHQRGGVTQIAYDLVQRPALRNDAGLFQRLRNEPRVTAFDLNV